MHTQELMSTAKERPTVHHSVQQHYRDHHYLIRNMVVLCNLDCAVVCSWRLLSPNKLLAHIISTTNLYFKHAYLRMGTVRDAKQKKITDSMITKQKSKLLLQVGPFL